MGQVEGSKVRHKRQIARVDGAQLVEGQVHQQHGQLTEGRAQVRHVRDTEMECMWALDTTRDHISGHVRRIKLISKDAL